MADWSVGLSTGCFYQTSLLDCLGPIRDGGFCMLEICSSPSHLDYHDAGALSRAEKRMEELGMEAYSFHAPFADHIDITALDGEHRWRSEQEIRLAAEAAARLGVRYFVIHPGPEQSHRPPTEEHLVRLENAAGVLNRLSRRCRELGISLLLENMLPHLLFGRAADMMWLMGALEPLSVGTCLDTGHAFLSGDLLTVTQKLSGHLKLVHANDNRGHYDDHLPPGDGGIDWHGLLAQLASADFRGGLILELRGGDRSQLAVLEDARRSRRHLREIMRRMEQPAPPS